MATEAWKTSHQEEMKAYRRKHYQNHKEPYLIRAKNQRKEIRDWFKEFKRSLKCARCPENHPACLDFHHRDSSKKDMSIRQAVNQGWGKKRILAEIRKCEILCSNCHRKEHHPEI
jgi:hypothetical protein